MSLSSNNVPGLMYCAKCNFSLTRTVLNVTNGTSSAGDSKTEPCPNGCGPLWPVSWEKHARDGWEMVDTLWTENESLKARLKNLGALQ